MSYLSNLALTVVLQPPISDREESQRKPNHVVTVGTEGRYKMARCHITLDIDENDLGTILRHRPKVVSIDWPEERKVSPQRFAEEIRRSQKGGDQKHSRVHECVLIIMQRYPNDRWQAKEVEKILSGEFKYRPNSTSVALSGLKKNGYVENPGIGIHVLTEKGRNHKPSLDASEPQMDPKPFTPRNGSAMEELILNHFPKGEKFLLRDAMNLFLKDGRWKDTSASKCLSELVVKGLVLRLTLGVYMIPSEGPKKGEKQPWTEENVAYIKQASIDCTPVEVIAKKLKRSPGAVRQKALDLGIPLGKRRRRPNGSGDTTSV
jgi:hypothetical protein